MQYSLSFPTGTVKYIFEKHFSELKQLVEPENCVLLVDSRVYQLHEQLFVGYKIIIVQASEDKKSLDIVAEITAELLKYEAHRKTTLVGVGGGIVTDITGLIASVYMRGIPFGFVPTTLLGMADAAIGGKNGVNIGLHKNLLGTILQPSFILYDTRFLETLPTEEWSNGFAEVIKYACLFDKQLFEELSQHNIDHYRNNKEALTLLIERCADWKNKIVLADEKESGKRKLLNFGHTAGHTIETLYHLPHGYAVGIGMLFACTISEEVSGLDKSVRERLQTLLQQYGLPVHVQYESEKVMQVLMMDKKRNDASIDYVLLEDIGQGVLKNLSFVTIQQSLEKFAHAGNN